jgi:uncharacterized membrane protein YjgN (DUF898 family)
MSNPQFEVVLKGVLAGFDSQQAQADFSALFSLDADKTARMFAASRTVLKKGLDQETADKYSARLAAIGVETVVEAMAVAQESLSLAPIDQPDAQEVVDTSVFVRPSLENSTSPSGEQATQSESRDGAVTYQPKTHAFIFTGQGFEYFKIWIVNILLTIVTLGIYSAWAKVRNLQYFYGNTRLNNSTFEYTAKPLQILKGRIIAMVLLIAYSLLSHFSPMMALGLLLVLIIATPWIVVLSLRFNARFTSYRNIAFRFDGSVSGAFVAYVVWPIVAMFSLGLLLPFAWRQQAQYIIGNHSYGDAPFAFDVKVSEYYKMLGIVLGGSIVFFVAYFMIMGGGALAMAGNPAAMNAAMIPMVALYLAFYLVVGAYVAVTMANIQFNNTALSDPKSSAADHRFSANWEVLSYMKLLLVNTVLILLTLGLFIPFAKIRTAAYKAEHTSFVATSDLDTFVAGEREQSNSLAEGVNDLFAMDISI